MEILMLECETIKPGRVCIFMNKTRGCTFTDGVCYPIIEQCNGCDRISEYSDQKYCDAYSKPSSKWISGSCPLATHLKKEDENKGKFVNPLKKSKKSKARRK